MAYRTIQMRVKPSHSLYNYFNEVCFNSKNLYNIANFYIRQIYTGLSKPENDRQENQVLCINNINNALDEMNQNKIEAFEKRKKQGHKSSKSKKEPTFFATFDENNTFISLDCLESYFKLINQVDYKSLPAQVNTQMLKVLYQDWKSFFAAIKEYNKNPSKFSGRPKTPRYANKNGRKVATFTNQNCLIKDGENGKFLSFPKTKEVFEFGGLKLKSNKLKSVRVIPKHDFFVLEVIVDVETKEVKTTIDTAKRMVGIDLGVSNFTTIGNNIGLQPIIIKGNVIKAKNQFYNKQRAKYYSILRMGKSPKEGLFTSKRLRNIDSNRHAFMKDYFHKVSKRIVEYCVKNEIDTIIVGKNKHWKDEVSMRKKDKQNFIGIPYNIFLNILEYKANEVGILFISTEESYTSKASFVDNDNIPKYEENKSVNYNFSGKRIKRGLYKTNSGKVFNADVNGACNIIRKAIPSAFNDICINYILNSPRVFDIA